MNEKTKIRLAELNADCESVFGSAVRYFFCPILYLDDDTELCKAHLINRSFRDSDRSWTIQRADVDSFYGTFFEADFVAMREKGLHKPDEVIADKDLARLLKPKILVNGEVVEYYYPKGEIPPNHSLIKLFTPTKIVELALKRAPAEMQQAENENWKIHIDKNINLPALVSLIKAAHLTLFHLCGYRHVFSRCGFFLGRDVLGEFFLRARKMERVDALEMARTHFSPLANMVRPVLTNPSPLTGTATDHLLYVCLNGNRPWALLIFLRTESHLNAVLVPTLDDKENAIVFDEFLKKPSSTIDVRYAQWKGDSWELYPKAVTFFWPEAKFYA